MNLIKRYPITSFFVLSFVLVWSIRITLNTLSLTIPPVNLVAEYSPTIAAIIVAAALDGGAGVRALLSRVGRWRVNPGWYLLVLVGPAALELVALGLFVLVGGPGARLQFPGLNFGLLFLLLLGLALSLGEEIGWRGFALPHMQTRFGSVGASLIIGALWAIWHIPGDITNLRLLTLPTTYIAFLWFLSFTMLASVLMGWVYNRTGGSILIAALFHLGLSILWRFVMLPEKGGQFSPNDLFTLLMGVIIVTGIVVARTCRSAPTPQPLAPVSAMGENTVR